MNGSVLNTPLQSTIIPDLNQKFQHAPPFKYKTKSKNVNFAETTVMIAEWLLYFCNGLVIAYSFENSVKNTNWPYFKYYLETLWILEKVYFLPLLHYA